MEKEDIKIYNTIKLKNNKIGAIIADPKHQILGELLPEF